MEKIEDFLKEARSFGITPNFYKAEVVRGEILYFPDRENYPTYWERKDREEIEKLKVKCSYKEGKSHVLDYMKERKLFQCIEEYAIQTTHPLEEQITFLEEEIFEISRSELLVLSPYYNLMPFILHQLTKEYKISMDSSILEKKGIYGGSLMKSEEGKILFICPVLFSYEHTYIVPWQDYMEFLKRRDFDYPRYAVPGII